MDNRYRHVLLSNDSGERLELTNAPDGWDAQRFNILKDIVYFGVMKSISVEYEFVGEGFEFLQKHRLKYGMDADIMLRVYKKRGNLFLFEGKINYENYDEDRKYNKFKVDIIQSSFVQKFHNREDVKLNVLNDISLDRKAINAATLRNATVRGKQIRFYSLFEGSSVTEPDIYATTVPFLTKVNGNPSVNTSAYVVAPPPSGEDLPGEVREQLYGTDGSVYVNNTPTNQTINFDFKGKISIQYKGTNPVPILTINDVEDNQQIFLNYRVVFRIATTDSEGNIDQVLYERNFNNTQGVFDLAYADSVVIPPACSLAFVTERWTIFEEYVFGSLITTTVLEYQSETEGSDIAGTLMRTEVSYPELYLELTTDSEYPDTEAPVILPHELFTNLVQQINGGQFYSDFFGREDLGYAADGDGAYTAIVLGALLRGIPVEEVQITCSFREAFKSYSSIFCLGAIITEGQIRVEPLEQLLNSNIATDIGEVNDLHIQPAKDFIFNSVKVGYPINEYEKENGRDEFNTTYQYTNSFQSVKKELDLVSIFFGDSYGIEFARRENVLFTGTADSRYDSKIFFIDLIKDGTELKTRRTEGILHVEGIFSPQTAMNLRIAAGQNMLRWRKYLNIPLHKKNQKVYFFQSKDKNASLNLVTNLGTTIDGEDLFTGNGTLFLPEERKCKSPMTLDHLFAILENPLGLVKFKYKGEQFFDYLFEVECETDKAMGTWRFLGTRDTPVETQVEATYGDFIKFGPGIQDFLRYSSDPNDIVKYGPN